MKVTVEELAMLLGQKDIEILVLQKTVAALQAELTALKPKESKLEVVQ